MKKKPVLTAILILFAVVLFSNVYNMGTSDFRPAPTATPAPTGKSTALRTVEMARNIVANALPGSDVGSRYDEANDWAFFDISDRRLDAETVQNAKDGVGHYREDWDQVVQDVINIQKSVQRLFTSMGMEETTVVVDVLNPDNEDEVFLSVANGIAGYDVVSGVNLLDD